MATTSKYFVLTPTGNNLDFLDFDLSYGNGSITTVGESVQFNGSPMVDSVFVRPGLTYDLSSTAGSTDKIYLTGNLADYQLAANSTNSTLTLSRTVGGLNESVTVSRGTSNVFDRLVFANGNVTTVELYDAASTGGSLPKPSLTETSLAPIGAAAPGAHLEATIKAFSSNPAAAGQVGETFASVRPGINYIVNGGNGIDTIYVADGSKVDATVLGQSVDLVYMRGKWSDYSKSLETNDTVLLFTRQVNGATESVKVDAGTSRNFDRLIFADGSVTTFNAKTAITSDPNVGLEGVAAYNPKQTTPLYSDAEVAAALAIIRDAAANNNATADTPTKLVYQIAGVKEVTADNLASINSALNSTAITGALADTTQKVQAIVDAYNAILASADGKGGNTTIALTGDQYAAVGVGGASGTSAPAAGSALYLLDDAVDRSERAAVDTQPELQNLFDAAKAVQAQAAGTAGLTMAQLGHLGVTDQKGVLLSNSADITTRQAILAKIAAAADDGTATDTVAELQALVNSINHAPVITAPVVSSAVSGLFATSSVQGTAIGGPAIDGNVIAGGYGGPGTIPVGWSTANTGTSPDLNDYNMGAYAGVDVRMTNLEGRSLGGGAFENFVCPNFAYGEVMGTTLTGLVAGQTYTYALQWQQVAWSVQTFTNYYVGGGFKIIIDGVVHHYTSAGPTDGWQLASYSFVASSTTANLIIGLDFSSPGTGTNGGVVVADSLSAQQISALMSTQGTGATTNAVFGAVTDVDPGASLKGWAITSAAADASGQHWQYSSNNGSTWANMDAASSSQAIYLATTDLVRWTGLKGSNTELDAKAVDNTGPALHAAGAAANLVDASLSGHSSAFSGNSAVLAAQAADVLPNAAADLNQAAALHTQPVLG